MREAKAYLIQFSKLKRYIRARTDELAQLRNSLLPGSVDYSGVSVQTTPSDHMAEMMAKIDALEQKIRTATEEAMTTLAGIEETIRKMEDPQAQALIIHHYINELTWEETADVMGYDLRWIYRLHGRALEQIEDIISH